MAKKYNVCHCSVEVMLRTLNDAVERKGARKNSVMTTTPYVISYEKICDYAYAICVKEWGKKVGLLIRDAGLGYFLACGLPVKMEDVELESISICIARCPEAFDKLFNAAFRYWDTVNTATGTDGLSTEPKDWPFVVYSEFARATTPSGLRMGWLVG